MRFRLLLVSICALNSLLANFLIAAAIELRYIEGV